MACKVDSLVVQLVEVSVEFFCFTMPRSPLSHHFEHNYIAKAAVPHYADLLAVVAIVTGSGNVSSADSSAGITSAS
jgi:hypothetical protein